MKLIAKVKLFYREARTKLTTWVALAIAAVAELAAHAEELLNQMPSFAPFLPKAAVIQTALMHVAFVLGLFTIYARVRRLLKSPAPA